MFLGMWTTLAAARTQAAFSFSFYPLCLLVVFVALGSAQAQQQTQLQAAHPGQQPYATGKAFYTGHFNTDGVKDTLYAQHNSYGQLMPTALRWGLVQPNTTQAGYEARPGEKGEGATPLPTLQTTFLYPSWKPQISFSILRYNRDTLDDIILHIWGEELVQKQTLQGNVPDTLHHRRSIALFGQDELQAQGLLALWDIDTLMLHPFRALALRRGKELRNPKVRDYSGQISYELPPIDFPVGKNVEQESESTTLPDGTRVYVYPNPANNSASIRADRLPVGMYTLRLFSVEGRALLQRDIQVTREGMLVEVLPLQELAAGYYTMRLQSAQGVNTSYPLVIVR